LLFYFLLSLMLFFMIHEDIFSSFSANIYWDIDSIEINRPIESWYFIVSWDRWNIFWIFSRLFSPLSARPPYDSRFFLRSFTPYLFSLRQIAAFRYIIFIYFISAFAIAFHAFNSVEAYWVIDTPPPYFCRDENIYIIEEIIAISIRLRVFIFSVIFTPLYYILISLLII